MSTMTNATPLVLPLQDVGRSDLAVAGGKGANLGELIHAGFSIPPGFPVTTVSYDHFVAHNHLDEIYGHFERSMSTALSFGTPSKVSQFRSKSSGLWWAYAPLGEYRLAVRSSATAKDLPGGGGVRRPSRIPI